MICSIVESTNCDNRSDATHSGSLLNGCPEHEPSDAAEAVDSDLGCRHPWRKLCKTTNFDKETLASSKKTLWAFPDEMCNPTVGGGERTSRPLPDFGNGHLLFASHSDVTNSRIHVTPPDLGNLNRFQENRMYQRSRGVDVDTKQSKMNKKRVTREFLKSLRCCRQRERETPAGPRPGSVSVATYSGIIEYI